MRGGVQLGFTTDPSFLFGKNVWNVEFKKDVPKSKAHLFIL